MFPFVVRRRVGSGRSGRLVCPSAESLDGRLLLSAGDLDLTFGSPNGFALVGATSASAVGLQSTGRVVVAGSTSSNGYDFRLAQLTNTGALVTSMSVDFAGRQDAAKRLAVLDDDSILVVGTARNLEGRPGKGGKISYYDNDDFGLVKFGPGGAVDTSFGVGGKVSTNISAYTTTDPTNRRDRADAVGIQPDGKILVGGATWTGASTTDAVLVRYNANGTPDVTFGVDGVLRYTLPGYVSNGVWDLSVFTGVQNDMSDDRILTLEAPKDAANKYAAQISSYRIDGTLDTSFGTNGRALVTDSGSLGCWDMAVDADGSILVTGYYDPALSVSGDNDAFLLRLTATGARDSNFGTSGLLVWDAGSGSDDSHAVAIQPDGKIVVAGKIESSVRSAYLARFNANGSIDATFGVGGQVVSSFTNSSSSFSDVILQPDGKIVAVGAATTQVNSRTTRNDFLVARYDADSAPLITDATAATPVRQTLSTAQARRALSGALAYWRALGEDTSRLGQIDLAIADLGGNRLGEASGSTITLDDNAVGWGWAVGRRPGRVSPRRVLIHEVGHLLGRGHADGGVMGEALAPGVRLLPADRSNLPSAAIVTPTSLKPGFEAARFGGRRPRTFARA